MSTASEKMTSGNPVPRAIIGCVLGLAVWWFLLKRAFLYALFLVSYIPLLFLIAPSGYKPVTINDQLQQWVFNVALNVDVPNPNTGKLERAGSIEFAAKEDGVAYFVSGWIVFLALSFAVGGFRKDRLLATAKGFGVQTVISVLGLAVYAYVNAYGSAYSEAGNSPLLIWWLRWVYHVDYLVVPFAGPFIIALTVHPRWREYLLPKLPA